MLSNLERRFSTTVLVILCLMLSQLLLAVIILILLRDVAWGEAISLGVAETLETIMV